MSNTTTYRQMTRKLRVQRGAGNADLVSERPVKLNARGEPSLDRGGNVKYLDGDGADGAAAPTLVTFDELCQVNVGFLLRTGAIVEWAGQAAEIGDRRSEVGEGPDEGPLLRGGKMRSKAAAVDQEPAVPGAESGVADRNESEQGNEARTPEWRENAGNDIEGGAA